MAVPFNTLHILPQRSDVTVGNEKINKESCNIVEEYKIGNTTIQIDDCYYRDNSLEQTKAHVDMINAIGLRIARAIYENDPDCEIFK